MKKGQGSYLVPFVLLGIYSPVSLLYSIVISIYIVIIYN